MIFNSFYMLFKSNSKQAVTDIEVLEKKIDSLKEKGKKRSEQENKDLKESIKQQKELTQQLKETENQYTKMVESATQAITAYISFSALSRGLFSTVNTNAGLELQSKLIGQNAVDIKAYGAAVEAAGGSAGAFSSHLQGLFENFSAIGLRLPAVEYVVKRYRDILKQASGDIAQQEMIFQKLGISDPGLKSLLVLPDAEFNARIAKQKEFAANTVDATKISRQYAEEWANTGAALDSVFTSISTDILPVFISVNKTLQEFFGYLKDNKRVAEITFAGAATGVTLLSGAIVGSLVPALAGLTTVAGGAMVALAPLLALAGGGALIADSISNGKNSLVGKSIEKIVSRFSPNKRYNNSSVKESYSVASEPVGVNDTPEMAQQRRMREAIRSGQRAIDVAGSSQIGTVSTPIRNKQLNIKIGDINVYTDAATSQGIASNITGDLASQLRTAIANLDDGVDR